MMNHTALTELNAILAHIAAAYAPNTIRAYRADMQEFIRYCGEHGQAALPAEPATVAQFMMTMSGRGIKTSTIRRKNTAISAVHRYASLADPT